MFYMGMGLEIWAVPQRFGVRCLHPLSPLQFMHTGRVGYGTQPGGQAKMNPVWEQNWFALLAAAG